MTGTAALVVLLGIGIGAGLLLIVVGVRGTTVDPTRPPSRVSRAVAALRSPALAMRCLAAAAVAVGVLALTGWPVAAAGLAALVLLWPKLFGGGAAEARQIASLEALVVWTESLRDTIAAHASLEHAIPAAAVNPPELIRPALIRLIGQIRARVPMDRALLNLAAELNDPSADLVIAALILNVRRRGDRLGEVLTGLAASAREELEMRRKISAGRAQLRRGMQLVVAVTLGIAVFLVVFSRTYIAPYSTVTGQVALAVVVGIFAAAFAWMRNLSVQPPVPPFLTRPGSQPDPIQNRLLTTLVEQPALAGNPLPRQVSR
ncbi:type II secretion system F family protein [Nakamurella sp. GG22]